MKVDNQPCPRNSFTNLIPDLVQSRNINFDEEQRKPLSDFVSDALYEAHSEAKFAEFSLYWNTTGEDRYLNSYSGISRISLPYTDHDSDCKAYKFSTTALSGSVSTPYFGQQPFDENKFEKELLSEVYIYVSDQIADGGYILVDIEYDIEESSDGYIFLSEERYDDTLNRYDRYLEPIPRIRDGHIIKMFNAAEYELDYDDEQEMIVTTDIKMKKRIRVKYRRNIPRTYSAWKTKRNTGMKVSWRYEPVQQHEVRAEEKYVEENKLFNLLANIVHHYDGSPEELEGLVTTISKEKQKEIGISEYRQSDVCRNIKNEKLISNKYQNISMEPNHNEISNKNLGKDSFLHISYSSILASLQLGF